MDSIHQSCRQVLDLAIGERRRTIRSALGMLAAAVSVALACPPGASAAGSLTYDACLGDPAAGCASVPGNPLQPALGLAVGPDGSVYETRTGFGNGNMAGNNSGIVSRLSAGPQGRLSFNRCLSDDGTGGDGSSGTCGDIPGSGTPLVVPIGVAVSPNGRSIYVTDILAGTLSHLTFEDGQFTWDACMSGDGSGGQCVQGPQHGTGHPFVLAQGLSVSPNASAPNSSVYFSGGDFGPASESPSVSHVFADPNNGNLNYDGCVSSNGSGGTCTALPAIGSSLGPGANGDPPGATATAINPQGTAMYAVSAAAGTVSQFAISPLDGGGITGRVGCLRAANNNVTGCDGIGPQTGNPLAEVQAVAVSADGTSVFTASFQGTVSHFFADAAGQGILSWDGCVSDDGTDGNGTGGACTAVPEQNASSSNDTGSAPSPNGPLNGTDSLAVSPDGKTLYVAAAASNSVSWFSIAPQGQLTFQGCMSDDVIPACTQLPGAPLNGAESVAVSPDGASVYVGSINGVANFCRDTGNGGRTRTVSAKIDNQAIRLVTSLRPGCGAKSGSLRAALGSLSIPGSNAAKLRSTGATFSIDRGLQHVHRRRLPATVSLKLAGLGSGSHTLTVKVLYHKTVRRHGHRHTVTVSKTLRLAFKVR